MDTQSRFEQEGYLLLRDVVPVEALRGVMEAIVEAVDRRVQNLHGEGTIHDPCVDAPFHLRWQRIMEQVGIEQTRRSWDDEVVCPALFQLMSHPSILKVVEPLIGPEIIATGIIAVRPKIPHDKRTTVLWHQDSNYFGEDAAQHRILTVWLPLVDTDARNGCMQVIPNSHTWGYQSAEIDPEHQAYRPLQDPTERGEPLLCQMQVGDLLLFDNLLMHRSGANQSDHTRWSIDFRYHGPEVHFDRQQQFLPGFCARNRSPSGSVDTWQSWSRRVEAFRQAAALKNG